MSKAGGSTADPPAGDPADRWFESRGARLRYRDEGQGPAVLLIHGWTLDLDQWEPQVAALRGRFRMVRFDRRGFGLSQALPSLQDDVTDALTLCDRLGLGRFAVAGMSQGARVAVMLAAAAPARVYALVLDGAPASIAPAPAEPDVPVGKYRELLRAQGIEAFRDAWRRNPMAQLRTADSQAHALLDRMLQRYRGLDLLSPSAPSGPPGAAAGAPGGPALGAIRIPALVMAGALDVPSRRDAARAIRAALAGAQFVLVPDAGHLANLDNPAAYNASLAAFLEGVGSGANGGHA